MNEMMVLPTDTLPALQAALDGLRTGQTLHLTGAGCNGLFGVNDAIVGRVANLARGHGCSVVWDDAGLTFRRQPHAAGATTAAAGELSA